MTDVEEEMKAFEALLTEWLFQLQTDWNSEGDRGQACWLRERCLEEMLFTANLAGSLTFSLIMRVQIGFVGETGRGVCPGQVRANGNFTAEWWSVYMVNGRVVNNAEVGDGMQTWRTTGIRGQALNCFMNS